MSIQTGKAPLGAGTVAAILSLSLVVNLPGLAVTPLLGTLQNIFPDTTQLEKQLLTVLPNLLIIPCLLLAGRLSLLRCKIAIVVSALYSVRIVWSRLSFRHFHGTTDCDKLYNRYRRRNTHTFLYRSYR